MTETKREYHRRLHNFEAYDEVRLKVVPRFKTSGLSGDEWRQSVRIELLFKGEVVGEKSYGSMEYAIAYLPSFMAEAGNPIAERIVELEKTRCDQPSCRNATISKYRLKRLTSAQGEYLDASEHHADYHRRFCVVHLRRGDCSREDSDDNYEVVEGPGPNESTNTQESPSRQVAVEVDSVEDVPEAVEAARRKLQGEDD